MDMVVQSRFWSHQFPPLEIVSHRGPGWIYSNEWVLPSLILMSLWGIGGGIVIYLARLQSIPTELYEAAEIDGAGGWRKLRNITLPLMTPVIFFNLIMGSLALSRYSRKGM